MFATVFVLLYVAHLVADYAIQTDHQAAVKDKPGWAGWSANLAHAGSHVAACAVTSRSAPHSSTACTCQSAGRLPL